ncbi:hypothetical protein M422DRAFT_274591 [Sphaerobolus stellatus SS14]|uniref:Uncharacterized protein n=1 Tax=Sphaerobolus stellatus (strain SS14) TaxID=990650 RepID=A0A0C9UHA6_SPHS4|nr:hypothetical protein M422DRAFT_274591 [Sphaerobolus stellatus SS14]
MELVRSFSLFRESPQQPGLISILRFMCVLVTYQAYHDVPADLEVDKRNMQEGTADAFGNGRVPVPWQKRFFTGRLRMDAVLWLIFSGKTLQRCLDQFQSTKNVRFASHSTSLIVIMSDDGPAVPEPNYEVGDNPAEDNNDENGPPQSHDDEDEIPKDDPVENNDDEEGPPKPDDEEE